MGAAMTTFTDLLRSGASLDRIGKQMAVTTVVDRPALDAEPLMDGGQRAANPIDPARVGREVIVSLLPERFEENRTAQQGLLTCRDANDCEDGQACQVVSGALRTCGTPLAVTPGEGYCNAQTGPGNWLEFQAPRAGIYVLHFVGETETLNARIAGMPSS